MITIIAFLILLGVLVVIHEGGHFFVLRMCKVHVDRFSVGMGPVIYKKKDKKGNKGKNKGKFKNPAFIQPEWVVN